MTSGDGARLDDSVVISDVSEAEGYIVSICFKNGPPQLTGVELEWTVHDQHDPTAYIERARLSEALGPHAPTTLVPDSSQLPLGSGGIVTVEPGGQVEISSRPHSSLAALAADTSTDTAQLTALLAEAGLLLGHSGIDPCRSARMMLQTPRYRAMRRQFDAAGPHGVTMMCCTAGLQVCIDAGQPEQLAARWSALHALGPVLLAAFANSPRHAGRETGWASARMRAWLGMDRSRCGPVYRAEGTDPAQDWAWYALAAPLLCRRRPGTDWTAPYGLTFADWIRHGAPSPPTVADLNYHLGTLFPPVRPRGYLELRYLDSQPAGGWLVPTAILSGLGTDEALLDDARRICSPVRHRWQEGAQFGLADPPLGGAAQELLEVACRAVEGTDLPPPERDAVTEAAITALRRNETRPSARETP